ncbi:putative NF-X1 finger and helicase domain protein [Aspergillus glaucus CBS 516.65]|uniref:Uncharacterized protein n=1 Tax=Aspergillus glaucus CBS 516.65 TaxID=1160497 RepID=A0A1L9VMF1_ASPGL|nr:hypothetical protein ASPGLDRAFT_73798 [Aspergillus glaucus CBS 516.65]OJJ85103.1 hypothetical protein ASPGLDRAFT_73798 [Aspergillus glaucus CBS 516.65]
MCRHVICREFANSGACKFKKCKFAHVKGSYSPATNPKERKSKPTDLSNSEREFRTWRRDIPLDVANARPLRGRLAPFFQDARRLIDVDAGVRQDVIQALARDGGLMRIKELVGQDFQSMATVQKENVFKKQMLPFLEIVSHPSVLSSLVLEQVVGTIYNFLFGFNGERASGLFKYICDVLETANKDEDCASRFDVSVHVFSKIVDLNSTAIVQESLKAPAKRFEDVFLALSTDTTDIYHNARSHLERLLCRLEVGSSLPSAAKKTPKTATSSVSFVIRREPPGGRHDNDHRDICDISIMPSFQEISCNRTEYLPIIDPTQWHVGGLDGLLDRNFRLLREDTIGQLRDAIHSETDRSKHSKMQKSQQRTYVYSDVQIVKLSFGQLVGFHFEIGFPQPTAAVRAPSAKERENWWRMSKRLQPGALICLIIKGNQVLFCTVTESPRPSPRKEKDRNKPQAKSDGLWKESTTATVSLELTNSNNRDIQCILDHYSSGASRFTLVEFPGVLLPAFGPTLRALQSMKRTGSLPFADLLVSTNERSEVSFPPYAMKPGFAFDLSSVMDKGANLSIRPGQPVDLQYLQQHSSLDDAQAAALVSCLQRKIGLVQGPPGTGKSYTGVALIKVLLANKMRGKTRLGPIICVTYTNHALDQLLEALIDKNVTSQIVRIGSQSKSERLEPFNLRNVARNSEATKMEKSGRWNLYRQLEENEDEFETIGLDKNVSFSRLSVYLHQQYPDHYNQLFGNDEDDFEKPDKDPRKLIKTWLHTGSRRNGIVRPVDQLDRASVYEMSQAERAALFNHWGTEMKAKMHEEVIELASSHSKAKSELDNIRDEVRLRCLNEADIIGLTTTGLARNLNMLQRLQSKVVLCEEAGEVLESHLLTAFLPSVEHAILIGDHLQLRPQVQNYELSRENRCGGEKYSLDVSLFERLVDSESVMGSGLPFSTLETQRRMHPSIAQLVRDTLYPQLIDSPSTLQYPEVVGMRKRLFWLDHRMFENDASSTDAVSTSHWNKHEIEMTAALVNHLVRQGKYKNGDIAVLTPYLGQLHRLRQKLSQSFTITLGERDQDELDKAGFEDGDANNPAVKATLLQTLRAATIDNFQGEEAKVVVVSLVRSNPQNRCGFLRTSNRINVLLSRAQHGMYIIGNSQTSIHVDMWANVVEILRQNDNIGATLQLQCPRHPQTPMSVSQPDDFLQVSPEGGCNQRCVNRLSCGHACIEKCHSEMLHNAVYCLEPCPRPRKGCTHPCPKRCGNPCPAKCTVNVFQKDRVLECGHLMPNLPCWQSQDLSTVRCTTLVMKEVPDCHHKVSVSCFIDVKSRQYSCTKLCHQPLPCGHKCKNLCSKCVTKPDSGGVQIDHGACKQECGRKHSTCAHTCTTQCHGDEPCPPCPAPCDVSCGHSRCMRKCKEPCTPCAAEKCFSACPHSSCTLPCAAPCDHIPCSRRCEIRLDCGHQCPSLCGETCPSSRYCQICGDEDVKNHGVDFILGEPYKEINLDENPCVFPKCGHFLTVESMDAQMDLKKHYDVDAEDRPVAITDAVHPFSMGDIKTCATCRGPLRDIARYGRLVRRAILDESTKKLILYLNREYVPLAQEVPRQIAQLQNSKDEGRRPWPDSYQISGTRSQQVNTMVKIMNVVAPKRWKNILEMHKRVNKYCRGVDVDEQPFNRVRDLVWYARQRNKLASVFEFDNNVLQTKGALQGTALSVRLDLALLADLLTLKQKTSSNVTVELKLDNTKEDCQELISMATKSSRILQQTEGYIFLAQLHALERSHSPPEAAEAHLQNCRAAITEARSLCTAHPGQTQGLSDEIDSVERMLEGVTFYTAVTNNERMAVIQAMAREFRGTGHWYYCQNGHPFTIGECGGAVQTTACPECGAPVGGRNHRTADGVTRAGDLENVFSAMRL